jgi:hypothetical protein
VVAVFLFVVVLWVSSEAQSFKTTGNPGDTLAGTTITAASSECTLDYTDTVGNPQTQVKPASDISVTVAAEYGFSGIGQPTDQGSKANVAVYYSYVVTNEGNASDTYNLTITNTAYGNGASGWTVQIVSNETDAVISSLVLAEDADGKFRVKVTPSTGALNTQYVDVTVKAATSTTPVGEYSGGNGLTYGGTKEVSDVTRTDVSGPTMTLTRVSTVDAPTTYTGNIHDAVPGAVITYTYNYSNTGGASSEGNVIVDRVSTYVEGSHVNATGSSVTNVNITAAQSSAAGWTVYTSEAVSPSRAYGNTTGWTLIGTIDAGTDYSTNASGAGKFIKGISKTTKYVKFEKYRIDPSEDNKTITWGVTIR